VPATVAAGAGVKGFNGRTEVKNTLVRKEWMYVSQEDVIKLRVALNPAFPDSYGTLRFPKQGFSYKAA